VNKMEKCVICGKDAIVLVNNSWLCEKQKCHEEFFSIDRIMKNIGTSGDMRIRSIIIEKKD